MSLIGIHDIANQVIEEHSRRNTLVSPKKIDNDEETHFDNLLTQNQQNEESQHQLDSRRETIRPNNNWLMRIANSIIKPAQASNIRK